MCGVVCVWCLCVVCVVGCCGVFNVCVVCVWWLCVCGVCEFVCVRACVVYVGVWGGRVCVWCVW